MIQNLSIKGFKSSIKRKCDQFGKSIEEEIRQAVTSKSPIESIAPEIYTPLKDGVLPQYDIRTDRQEIALDLTEKYDKSKVLHNDEKPEEQAKLEKAVEENINTINKNE